MPTLPIVILIAGVLLGSGGCQRAVSPSQAMQQKFFSSLKVSHPDEDKAQRFAHYYMLVGRSDLAQLELQRALKEEPHNLKLLNALGSCYDQTGQYSKAQETYQQILAQDPDHPLALNNLGYSYYLSGDFNRAETTLQEVLAKHPDNNLARNNLGLVWVRQGKEQRALSFWQKTDGDLGAREKLQQVAAFLGKSTDKATASGTVAADRAHLASRSRPAAADQPEKLARPAQLLPTGKIAGSPQPSLPEARAARPEVAKAAKPAAVPAQLSQNPRVQVEDVEMVIQPASYSPPPDAVTAPVPAPSLVPPAPQADSRPAPGRAPLPPAKHALTPAKTAVVDQGQNEAYVRPRSEKRAGRSKMVIYTVETPPKSLKEYIVKGYTHKNQIAGNRPEPVVF